MIDLSLNHKIAINDRTILCPRMRVHCVEGSILHLKFLNSVFKTQ